MTAPNPDLSADEKRCPFCAEVIKSAAIKCRYCGSELPEASVSPAPFGDVPQDDPSAEPPIDPSTDQSTDPLADPLSASLAELKASGLVGDRWRLMLSGGVTAGLVALLVLCAVVLFFVVRHSRAGDITPDGQQTSTATRSILMDQASKMTAAALSYQATTFDKDTAAAGKLMTASMRKQYLETLEKVHADVLKQGLVLKATVKASALISATRDQAKVLEFVNQTTTAKGVKTQQLNENRVVVTLTRTNDGWLISSMDAF